MVEVRCSLHCLSFPFGQQSWGVFLIIQQSKQTNKQPDLEERNSTTIFRGEADRPEYGQYLCGGSPGEDWKGLLPLHHLPQVVHGASARRVHQQLSHFIRLKKLCFWYFRRPLYSVFIYYTGLSTMILRRGTGFTGAIASMIWF